VLLFGLGLSVGADGSLKHLRANGGYNQRAYGCPERKGHTSWAIGCVLRNILVQVSLKGDVYLLGLTDAFTVVSQYSYSL
jgi:hypothetical protein